MPIQARLIPWVNSWTLISLSSVVLSSPYCCLRDLSALRGSKIFLSSRIISGVEYPGSALRSRQAGAV